jgi:hypothetical protein
MSRPERYCSSCGRKLSLPEEVNVNECVDCRYGHATIVSGLPREEVFAVSIQGGSSDRPELLMELRRRFPGLRNLSMRELRASIANGVALEVGLMSKGELERLRDSFPGLNFYAKAES